MFRTDNLMDVRCADHAGIDERIETLDSELAASKAQHMRLLRVHCAR
jgi:hypothetical protein